MTPEDRDKLAAHQNLVIAEREEFEAKQRLIFRQKVLRDDTAKFLTVCGWKKNLDNFWSINQYGPMPDYRAVDLQRVWDGYED